eukprot:Sspe_Gene.7951::Locus_2693_Transcript_1_1_Confidence_1.000_Length_750::g.7951::m.7951
MWPRNVCSRKVMSMIGEGCNAVERNMTVLEESGMELLLNMTAFFEGEQSNNYTVCWHTGAGWVEVATHDKRGARRSYQEVLGVPDDRAGASMRAAGELGGREECCEGLHIGEVCLPAALILVLVVLGFAAIGYLIYSIVALRGEREQLNKGAFDDFEMDSGSSPMLQSESPTTRGA